MGLFYSILKDTVTEKDGESYDVARILWIMGTLIFFGLTIFVTIKDPSTFNMMNFGVAFAGILAGGGASVAVKAGTEQPFKDRDRDKDHP